MDDVESIERATLAGVPPRAQKELDGWLLGLDDGTVGRAHSAAPLSHSIEWTAMDASRVIGSIADRYRSAGLVPVLRIPLLESFDAVRAALITAGARNSKPTYLQIGDLARLSSLTGPSAVQLDESPGDGWADVFLGEGFDPVDGASRLAILRRSTNSVFASVFEDGDIAAVGSACFSHGWCGIHGMRTAAVYRGRGMASRILSTLAREATRRGIRRVYLQVEKANLKAQLLYGRGGFKTAWTYEYWR